MENKSVFLKNSAYSKSLSLPISNVALFVSKNGTDIAGNIFRLIQELVSGDYGELTIVLAYTHEAKKRIVAILKRYNLFKMTNLVEYDTNKFFSILGRAKYFITDCFIPFEYIKRENQILVSTSHGTPIKKMGRDCTTEAQGLIQNTHILADYQTYSSDYMFEKLFSAFMEKDLFKGHALKSGYARNCIFFNSERSQQVKEELNINSLIAYAYLPTFRGTAASFNNIEQIDDVVKYCDELDQLMDDNEILFVKLHNFNKEKINFSNYKHICAFPEDYEVYDVLNAMDGLITDYSSVLFDFAVSKKKIILFQYDSEDYNKTRGTYLDLKQLPFPIVDTVESLYKEISTPKNYDDSEFYSIYCQYESPNATRNICRTIFLNSPSCQEFCIPKKSKKNIFVYAGKGIPDTIETLKIYDYLATFDAGKYNFFLFFYEYDFLKKQCLINTLPSQMQYFSHLCNPVWTYEELDTVINSSSKSKKDKAWESLFKHEAQRWFQNLSIDAFIDLYGKDEHLLNVLKHSDKSMKKIVLLDRKIKNYQSFCDSFDIILCYGKYCGINEKHKVEIQPEVNQINIITNCKIIEEVCN